jgi:hypothetical protein
MLTYICDSRTPGKAVYRCECGVGLEAFKNNVNRGHTSSCGCVRRRITSERSMKHGAKANGKRTRSYVTWVNMKARCADASDLNYGGRGIKVCERWQEFSNFLADMGEPPPKTTLDRIDNSKGYSPDNCRWAGRKVQATNKRTVAMYEYQGQRKHLTDWAKHFGINRLTLRLRIKSGVPFDVAVSTPGFLGYKRNRKKVESG